MTDGLRGGGRFRLRIVPGPPALVEKRGSPDDLAREAAALRLLDPVPGVPRVDHAEPGLLRTALLPGAPRAVGGVSSGGLRALGRLLRAVHDASTSPVGGLQAWGRPARDAAAYAAGRRADADAALAAAGVAAAPCPVPAAAGPPFRPLHGDLTAGNVVWHGDVPGIVDWEFWHWGDPAEDLAYLAEANHLTPTALGHVLDGYGAGPAGRVDGWRHVARREIAAWWVAEGRHDLALPHLERMGVSPPTAPSGRTPRGPSGRPA